MPANFTVKADPARDLIMISMSGFFGVGDIQAFFDKRAAEHARLRCGSNQHLTINDLTAMKVQPQETVAAFQSLLADPVYRSRRLAFVVSRTLARSQLMRALDGRAARCFEDRAEAIVWLLRPEAHSAAA